LPALLDIASDQDSGSFLPLLVRGALVEAQVLPQDLVNLIEELVRLL
jgi:hypothetical protein